MSRPVHKTGVFITENEIASIKRAMEPRMQIDFSSATTILETANERAGLERLQDIARSRGLPGLKPTYNYCLEGKQFVCFEDALGRHEHKGGDA